MRRLSRLSMILCFLQTLNGTGFSSADAERSFALEVNVTDDKGAPVPNATVLLEGSPVFEGKIVSTHVEGRFTFTGLYSGDYRIVVSAPDFVSSAFEDFFLTSETVRIVLKPRSSAVKRPTATNISLVDLAAPREAQAKYRKGLARQKEGRHQEAQGAFLAAIEVYPKYSAAYAGLGISLLQLREREEALQALRRALDLNPSSYDALLCAGLILNDLERFSEARDFLHAAQRSSSGDWRLHYELGRMYYGLSQLDEAEKSLRLARRPQPRYANLYLLLANTLALEGKHAEAISEFEEFLKIAPNNPAAGEVREKLPLLRAEVEGRKL